MSRKKLKAAVIGAGKMGSYHANIYNLLPDVTLCAVATKSTRSAKAKQVEFNVPAYTFVNSLLVKEQPDLVSIATPTSTHKEITIKCLKAGAHVLLEKPIAQDLKEAKAVIRAEKKYKRKVMIGHIERFNPIVVKTKKLLEEKRLGKILLYSAIRSGKIRPKPPSDVLLDLGIHDLYIFRYLTSEKVTMVYGKSSRKLNRKFDDFFTLICKTKSSTLFQLTTDWWRETPQRETRVIGTKGELYLNFVNKELTLLTEAEPTGKNLKVNKNVNQLEQEIKAFIRCIRRNTDSPIPTTEGLKALEFYLECKKHTRGIG